MRELGLEGGRKKAGREWGRGGDQKRPLQGERGGGGVGEREDQLKARVGVVGEALTVLGRKGRGDGKKDGWGKSKSLRALQKATEAILEAVVPFLEDFQRQDLVELDAIGSST